MSNIDKKTLEQMYDKYLRTGVNDWQNIETSAGKRLSSIGLVTENILGEFKLTDLGIAHMSN